MGRHRGGPWALAVGAALLVSGCIDIPDATESEANLRQSVMFDVAPFSSAEVRRHPSAILAVSAETAVPVEDLPDTVAETIEQAAARGVEWRQVSCNGPGDIQVRGYEPFESGPASVRLRWVPDTEQLEVRVMSPDDDTGPVPGDGVIARWDGCSPEVQRELSRVLGP